MDISIESQFALLLFPHEFGYQRLIRVWIEITREIDDEAKKKNRYQSNYDQAEPEVAVHRWVQVGAGEGNRTLVVSLGSFCSAIELHPRVEQIIRRNRGLALSRYRIQSKRSSPLRRHSRKELVFSTIRLAPAYNRSSSQTV
jgi:hypothetical protein